MITEVTEKFAADTEEYLETIEAKKVRGLDQAEREVEGYQAVIKTATEGLRELIYDIPTEKNEDCPNPSHLLWRIGCRNNLSCWILPERNVESPILKELFELWNRHGIEFHLFRYHPEELEKIRDVAFKKLQTRVGDVQASLITRLDDATKAFDRAWKAAQDAEGNITEASQYDIKKARMNRVKAVLRDVEKNLNSAVECAEAFDATEAFSKLFEGLRKALKAEQEAFAAYQESINLQFPQQHSGSGGNSSTGVVLRGRNTIWGWHILGILRWMGKNDWDAERAVKALKRFGTVIPAPVTVTQELASGKNGHGMVPTLTGQQIEELDKA